MKKELRNLNKQYSLKKQELNTVTAALNHAQRGFNLALDDSATEGCIYEINALRRRRNSILQEMQSIDRERNKYGNYF
ncbi:MAG: hypothetical protein IJ364_06500 [Oscillospiraceae bacterium]|nr:hypothetical protein [Oscillospiraceae bacterium]